MLSYGLGKLFALRPLKDKSVAKVFMTVFDKVKSNPELYNFN